MNEHLSPTVEADTDKPLGPLVERLDPAIGELSTVMGAMMTELVRRALRGSVRQIDDELQGQVAQKVDATIAHRLPAIEQSATEVAEKAAREAATEVAVEEVQALEQRSKEVQRELVGKIEQVEQTAESRLTREAHELASRIEETAKNATLTAEEKARELARLIEEAERRANEAAQAEVARQVEDLLQRSRRTTTEMKDRLQALETTAGTLGKQLLDEAGERKAEQKAVVQQLQQQEHARRSAEEQFRRELLHALDEARGQNAALERRVVELEKPRGLRALWAWLSGLWRKKAVAAEPEPEAEEAEAGRQA